MEAIRDQWLAPLVAEITEQAETIGQLRAERAAGERAVAELRERADQAEALLVQTRLWAEAAERERAELRRRAEAAESRVVGLERQGRNVAGERDEEHRRGDIAEQEGEDLRQRADTLQERHDALRSVAVRSGPPVTSEAEDIADAWEEPQPLLRRVWRALRGE